ncbi:MAG TPA: TatD family hydrolase, partial [Candidatus Baltobacteraceae bacterium]|nr:TatD family hydrolase [Candidatus Baltobacteraceae bacterium]
YKDDMDDVVRDCLSKGVQMVTIGTQKDTSANGIKLAERYDGVWATVGLHPSHIFAGYHDEGEVQFKSRNETFDPAYYGELLKHPKVVAVGEMGLDYHYEYENVSLGEMKAKEAAAFEAGARLAIENDLPVVIHCRDAHEDQAVLIEKIWGPLKDGESPRGVIHCFTGTRADAERYLAMGFMLAFGGSITYPPRKSDVREGRELLTDVVKWAPLDRIVIETDAPYLTPVPRRGERNTPAHVKIVAEKVAALRGISYEEVAEATTANARRLFRKMSM